MDEITFNQGQSKVIYDSMKFVFKERSKSIVFIHSENRSFWLDGDVLIMVTGDNAPNYMDKGYLQKLNEEEKELIANYNKEDIPPVIKKEENPVEVKQECDHEFYDVMGMFNKPIGRNCRFCGINEEDVAKTEIKIIEQDPTLGLPL